METEAAEFQISQLRLCDRKRHAYEVKPKPDTHLRGRPKKKTSPRIEEPSLH